MKYINPKRKAPVQISLLRFSFKLMSSLSTSLASKMAIKIFYRPRRSPLKASELEKLTEAKSFTFFYKNFKLQTYYWGEGKPILFIHGWDGKGIDSMKMIDPLVKAGNRVIIIDMPGHGKSTGNNIDMTDFIGSILLMQEKFGIFYGIIGHSFGGLAIITSLLHNKVSLEKLVLISSPASVDTVFTSFQSILKIKDKMLNNIKKDANRRTGLTMINYPSNEDISSINIPTFVIHDTYDMIVPSTDANKLNSLLPESKLLKTDNLGHQRILSDPEVISQVVKFFI